MSWNEALLPPHIFSITELTAKLRGQLELNFPFVYIKGEVTNLSRPGSGHLYFTLKDNESQIQCVWFKYNQPRNNFNPLTGEMLDASYTSFAKNLSSGIEIICGGKISIYSQRGQYQIIVEFAEYSGKGELAIAFEKQKYKLAAKGYFLSERKKKIPYNPRNVILITSPHGAALHDFMELANLRGYSSKIRLIPVSVQGHGSSEQIANAVYFANSVRWGDVIVIIRGGGSPEDLWAFNEEIVADAIFNSKIPVVAGIGHEVDVSIADLVADVRAATPSHAAELLWTSKSELAQKIDEMEKSLLSSMNLCLAKKEYALTHKSAEFHNSSPRNKLKGQAELLASASLLMEKDMQYLLEKSERILSNGINQLRSNNLATEVSVYLQKVVNLTSSLNIFFHHLINNKIDKLELYKTALYSDMDKRLFFSIHLLDKNIDILSFLDPYLPLKKGYCLLYHEQEPVLSSDNLQKGNKVEIIINNATITAEIISIKKTLQAE